MKTCYFCHLLIGAGATRLVKYDGEVESHYEECHQECLEAARESFRYDPGEKARRLS